MYGLSQKIKKHIGDFPVSTCNAGSQNSRRQFLLLFAFISLALHLSVFLNVAASHEGIDPEIEEITELLEKDPKNVNLLIKRGRLYRYNRGYEHSLKDLDRAQELNSENQVIMLERGITLSAMGRDQEAEVALDQYLEQASGRSRLDALAERAHIHARTGQIDLAIADFTSAISMHPAVELYLARGQVYESIGLLEEAAVGYRKGLSQLGNAILLKQGLIRVETARKRYKVVLALIDEELARAHVKTDWHLQRAKVLEAMGKANEAHAARDKALSEANRVLGKRVTPTHRVARAKVYIAMGRLEEAKNELLLAAKKAPRFNEASMLLRELETEGQLPN